MKRPVHNTMFPDRGVSRFCKAAAVLIAQVTVFFLLQGAAAAQSQSNVDRVADALDKLAAGSYDDWKVSPELKNPATGAGHPARPDFDDSAWKNLKLDEPIHAESCWLRKEIVLPAHMLGEATGGPLTLALGMNGSGELWVNGESKGSFSRNGEFELTKEAKAGQKFLIAIKASSTMRSGGAPVPLRLLRAGLSLHRATAMRQQLQDLALSLCVGQKLLSFDTYQTSARNRVDPGIDHSSIDKAERMRLNALLERLATQIDVAALADGSADKFNASVAQVRPQLQPVHDFAKRFTLFFDANAHIDAAWLWRDKETVEVVKNTFASVFNMMNARPDFTYTQSAAAYYDWMERLDPDIFQSIRQRVKDGRWEVVGGMWVEPDCNLPSGESWARHLLYSKRYFHDKLGVDVSIGWNPDSFGYNWNIPMFYANAGIDSFITQKIGWNDTNVYPYRVFWWQAPDGSRVLTYFPFSYVNAIQNPFALVDWLRQFEANTGFRKLMILFGVGDHGGGPSLEMIDRIERLKALDIFPAIEYGTAATYFDWLKQQDLAAVPTWNDELYLEYHQGTYTTQAKMKEFNRASEVLLTNAEKFSSLASLLGRKYNSGSLEEAWRDVLFNQFHDILPGSGIHENYIDATEKYHSAQALGQFELKQSLQHIAKNVDTSSMKAGTPVVVFNPLTWERTDAVTLALPDGDASDYAVFDRSGKEIPSQIEQGDKLHRSVVFIAGNIPSLGYGVFELRKQPARNQSNSVTISPSTLENDFFRLAVDPSSGWVKSIFDKRLNKEILSGPGNELQLLEDTPAQWDAWNIGLTGAKYPSKLRKIEAVEQGPVRATLRITRDYLKPGVKKSFPTEDFPTTFFTQDISLSSGLDRIDFKTDVDWWEEHTMLKVAFPVTASDSAATYEIPYGTIRRSTESRDSWEKAKVEVPAQRWADLSQADYGIALLNRAKYGYDIKGQVMRLSLLRSPKWPDPMADRGKHSIAYALYPHKGRVEQSNTVQRGYEYNHPLIAILSDVHRGSLPPSRSFVQLSPASLVLTTIKKAEDGDAWIFQWYDAKGEDSEAQLTLPRAPEKVVRSNFLEAEGSPEAFKGTQVTARTKKNSTVTLKVHFAKQVRTAGETPR